MELAPRDIVARAIQKEIDKGRGFENEYVHLDLTHLGSQKINERLPGIRLISMDFAGVDPIEKSIPVQPGQHYSMGGVDTVQTGLVGIHFWKLWFLGKSPESQWFPILKMWNLILNLQSHRLLKMKPSGYNQYFLVIPLRE
jgi:aspartate oxidase